MYLHAHPNAAVVACVCVVGVVVFVVVVMVFVTIKRCGDVEIYGQLQQIAELCGSQDDGKRHTSFCVAESAMTKHQRQQHAAACRSARFWELLVGVLKHAAASQNFHMADLFFHNMSNL